MTTHGLPSIEAIAYPREHTYAALTRSIENKSASYANFYLDIHSRPDPAETAQYPDLPTLEQTSPQFRRSMIQVDDNVPLSIVITTRNDTHVERMKERTQAFLDGIYYLAERFKRNVEIIIAEWNPPADRPSMAEQYHYPASHKFVSTVIVTVSNALHAGYKYAKDLPLYQMIAKNVGIRRARGRNILVTNVDILFSPEMFDFMTDPARVQIGKIYRANRWDVDRNILDETDIAEMIAAGDDKCIRRNTRQGATRSTWVRGVWNQERQVTELVLPAWFPDLHTEGCGDFQLMDRESWLRIGGYCEVDAFSMHIDSLFALTCFHAGLVEQDLGDSLRHYHIDHSLGDEVKPSVYLTRSKTELRHPSMMTLYNLHACQMNLGTAYAFNNDCWGMGATELPFKRVSRADWDMVALSYDMLGGKEGCRLEIEDMQWDEVLNEYLIAWSESSWKSTADYIEGIRHGRKIALWGMGGRARNAIHALEKMGLSFSTIIDDGVVELFDGANRFDVVKAEDLTESFFKSHIVLIAAIFAENIRPKLEALGALEGKDFIVSI